LSDGTDSAIDISMAYTEPLPDHLSTPPSSPDLFGSSTSSMRDPDDDEIILHHTSSPPADSHDSDMDQAAQYGVSEYHMQNVPPRTVRLMLPTHIHPAFPGCTPSTPAASQQIPQVWCQLFQNIANPFYRNLPAIQRPSSIATGRP